MLVSKKPLGALTRGGCLLLALLVLASGCKGKRRSSDHVEVTGMVTLDGQPLPGGRLNFVTLDGFNSACNIGEDGSYKINAPIGDVQISVDNRELAPKKDLIAKAASKGAGPRPGGPEPEPMKGKYVKIPKEYYDPSVSGLKYTVTKESGQKHNVELTSNR